MKPPTRDVQTRLKEVGLYTGNIDGIMGRLTVRAIRQFQRMHGLTPDGIAGTRTAAALWPAAVPERDVDGPEPAAATGRDLWPRQAQVEQLFGPVGQHQTMLELPFTMRIAWDKRALVHRFSIHEKAHDSASRCFDRIADAYTPEQRTETGIELFGGCLNVRPMTGGKRWSMHAYGLAIDFDPARNGFTTKRAQARLAKPDCETFWRIWEDAGWTSLGRSRDLDWMHIQLPRL
jgi:hypothetical protein